MQNKEAKNFAKQKKHFVEKMSKVEKPGTTKLILIVVANTLDDTIGKGCALDVKTVRSTIHHLVSEMEFSLVELIIDGYYYSNENVLSAIELLKPGNDDIVVFYYTGHGFRFQKEKQLKPPQIDLQSSPATNKIDDINKTTKNLHEIFDMIKTKGARLNIVIGDCCNDDINFTRKFNKRDKNGLDEKDHKPAINKDTCKEMFCTSSSSMLVAAADEGLLAIVDDGVGSIFTTKFTDNLKKKLASPLANKNEMHWEELLEKIKEETFHYSKQFDLPDGSPGNQKAFFVIESKPSVKY